MDELRIVLVGCVKTKVEVAPVTYRDVHGESWESPGVIPIAELYDSPLWEKRRAYAEASGHPWGVLSARYGVRMPGDQVKSYELTLTGRDAEVKAGAWAHGLCTEITRGIARIARANGLIENGRYVPGARIVLEVHVGAPYVRRVEKAIAWRAWERASVNLRVEHPVEGLQIGELLRWYNDQEESRLEVPRFP